MSLTLVIGESCDSFFMVSSCLNVPHTFSRVVLHVTLCSQEVVVQDRNRLALTSDLLQHGKQQVKSD